jgi:oligosaccharide repeat unit polymerase
MFVYAYIGLLPLYFGWDEYRYKTGVQDRDIVFQVYIFSVICMLGLIVGFGYAKYVFKLKSIQPLTSIRPLHKKEYFIIIILVLFCFGVLLYYLSKLSSIAFLVVFTDGVTQAKVTRSLMGNDFSGKYHWYSVIMHDLYCLITFALFSAWLVVRKRLVCLLFMFTFMGSTFSAVMAGEKAPFAWLLIGLFLTYCLTELNGKMPVKSIIKFTGILFFVLALLYMVFMGSKDFILAIESALSRAFTGGIQPAYHYLEFFPSYQDFLFGRSFPNPGGIMPFEPYRLTVEVMNWRFPNLAEMGVVGSMPTVFWAEAYANFGIFGVLSIPFFVGLLVWVIYYFTYKLENTPIKIGFLVWLMIHFKSLSNTGFSGYLFDFYLIIIFIIIIFTISITNNFKIKFYK